jgi:hypothetical protein
MPTYHAPVTRMESFDVSDAELDRERVFQVGKADRKAGRPCCSANGAYLNGWYSPDKDYYYITAHAAHLLRA